MIISKIARLLTSVTFVSTKSELKFLTNRYDYPKEWPELLPSLLHLVRTEDDLVQQRALLYLHHVTKSLASKRLAGDRRAFQDLSSEMYSYVYALYSHLSQTLLQQASYNVSKVSKPLSAYICLNFRWKQGTLIL